jgi:hypothetical protein
MDTQPSAIRRGARSGDAARLFTSPRHVRETAQVVEPCKRRSHRSRDLHGNRKHAAGINPGRRILSPS